MPRPLVRAARGIVLPTVLVILIVLTGLVAMQLRRSTVDERLASNTRETVMLDTAAQTVLRWCEVRVVNAPRATASFVPPNNNTVLWQDAAAWSDQRAFDFTGTALPGVAATGNDAPRCLVEDATCELAPPISPTGQTSNGCNGIDDRWRKFRITARVVTDPAVIAQRREHFVQSEVRAYID